MSGLWLLTITAGLLGATGDPDDMAFFESRIRPVLVEHCYECHSARSEKLKGGLRLDTRDGIRAGGDMGPAVVPGDPDSSLILDALAHGDDFPKMPPRNKLPDAVVADVRRWIEQGAPDPRDGSAAAVLADEQARRDWWSLRALERPPVPELPDDAWSRNPIDRFVLARLREAGLNPSPEADRRTLIRRVAFDLTGLPPTPEDVEAFVHDPSPVAYEDLVDRLLESPRYGERWARHWMDAAHYAETHGHDQDRIREHAWPYRDYLIESFNNDTPYGRFVAEQVAADALFPDEPRLIPALGFLAAGPWDESSLRDIREDSIDREIGRYLDRDDIVATVMSTVVSSTVHCARCHDHKFDPFSQEDYYSLQAVFAGTERADRVYDPDPALHRTRTELTAARRALRERRPEAWDALLSPEAQQAAREWERTLVESTPSWTVLVPQAVESSGGATLTVQPDGSIVSTGESPAADTYTITAPNELAGITAIRLEVLPDEALPHNGPGRNDNGNLHLTEFTVTTPAGVRLVAARADFDQAGWGAAAAIDGDPQTAWGIYPEVGRRHVAVFEPAIPLDAKSLTIQLAQTSPPGHLIGRFRLSVTASPRPVRPDALPGALAALADIPPVLRSDEQRRELAALVRGEALDARLALLPPPSLVYAGAHDFVPDASHKPIEGVRPVHVLRRGDIHLKAASAQPGTLSCLDGLPSRFAIAESQGESARRAALARWLADAGNPLTWRSIANRTWHHHFGRGICDTPNDLGRMGGTPSHPELLDWLAATFRDEGQSLKRLHRLIVTSATYRQVSAIDGSGAELDAENRLLGRMNRSRLDAEQVRDAVLSVAGRLDPAMGGPSVRQFTLSPGVHVTPVVDYQSYDWNSPGSGRRAVYRFVFRTLPDPFLDSLDAADASQLTAARNVSVTPLQALAMLNDPFMLWASDRFAERLESETGDRSGQVRRAFALALGRPASEEEITTWASYADRYGLPLACRMLLNSNEFLFVD